MSEPTYPDYLPLRKTDDPPPAAPTEDTTRVYADESGALRTIQPDGTDAPVAGAGVLPDPTDDGDVLTVVDGEWAGAAGGGSQPLQQVFATGDAVDIDNNAFAAMPWSGPTGDTLLDLTDPTAPTFLADGTYAVTTAWYTNAQFTAGGLGIGQLFLDGIGNIQLQASTGTRPDQGACPISAVFQATEGQEIAIICTNHDGAATRTFSLDPLTLVKLA